MFIAKAVRVLVLMWLCVAAGQVFAQVCKSPPEANNDNLAWSGVDERFEVGANDYDPAGRTISIASVTAVVGGTATVCCDGQAVYFVPSSSATEGSFNYTIVNSDGQTDTATANIGKTDVTLPPPPTLSFSFSCDGLSCTFRSEPSTLADLRSYSWEFFRITRDAAGNITSSTRDPDQCQRSEWLGQSFSCTFPSEGERAVVHQARYHGGEIAVTNPMPRYVMIASQRPEIRLKLSAPRNSLYVEAWMSTDLSDPITHYYKVDWGDGQVDSPTLAQIKGFEALTHTYASEGTQKVAILHQQSGTRHWEAINLVNKAPVPRLSASQFQQETWYFTIPYTGTDPTNGIDEFQVRSVPGPYGWEWPPQAPRKWELDFGDGSVETFDPHGDLTGSRQINHDYPRRGVYKARLLITDHLGATGVVEQEINVTNARPVARLEYFCDGGYCRFDGSKSTDETSITKYRFNIQELSNEGYWRTWKSVEQTTPFYDVPLLPINQLRVDLTVTDDQLAQHTATVYGNVQRGNRETALVFYALEPCSLGASRWVTSGGELWYSAKGVCGIPNDPNVVAAAINIRSYTPTHPGNMSRNRGDVASLMNINPSRPAQSNLVMVPYWSGVNADVLAAAVNQFPPAGTTASIYGTMEVVGYFRRAHPTPPVVETANAVGPLWFRPVQPCALFDTRKEPPAIGTTPRVADFRTRCGVSPDMAALTMHMAAIGPTVNSDLVAYSAASPLPTGRASIDTLAGRNLSNMVFSKVSNGMLKLATSSGTANAALTMSGAFVRDKTGDRFHAVAPCRVFDSRNGIGAPLSANIAQRIQIGGDCGISRYASAVLLYAAVVAPNGQGNLQLHAADRDMPDPYAVTNFLVGETIGSSAIIPLHDGRSINALLTMFSGNSAHVVVDVHGYFDGRRNVAAAANGAIATAADPTDPRFPPSAMIDGDRTGAGWGTGTGGWSDGSPNIAVDFVGVQFAAPARIDQVDLFTLPDDYANPGDPSRHDTFTKWGATAYDIGYWDAKTATWVYFPVTNNNLRWGRVIFPAPVVTDKLSIVVRSGCPKCGTAETDNLGGRSRIVEIEAWEVPAGTP